jgi:N-methylhydantoinase A/oxoprolinase/acetone carboxylase beta subunit
VYGYQLAGREVQLVNLRVTARGAMAHAAWPRRRAGAPAAARELRRTVRVAPGVAAQAAVHRFDDVHEGQVVHGPAVVEYAGSTLFLPQPWSARFDAAGNAHLTAAQGAAPQPQAAPREETA